MIIWTFQNLPVFSWDSVYFDSVNESMDESSPLLFSSSFLSWSESDPPRSRGKSSGGTVGGSGSVSAPTSVEMKLAGRGGGFALHRINNVNKEICSISQKLSSVDFDEWVKGCDIIKQVLLRKKENITAFQVSTHTADMSVKKPKLTKEELTNMFSANCIRNTIQNISFTAWANVNNMEL